MVTLLGIAACATVDRPRDELGQTGELSAVQDAALPAESANGRAASADEMSCRSRFATNEVAGFVEEWFGVVAGLQLTVDANPVRQFVRDPEGHGFEERLRIQDCGERIMDPFCESQDRRIVELARAMSTLLADAGNAERSMAERFRATDWSADGPVEAQARRWSEMRPSTRSLSERGAALTERVVALLREDGRTTYGPGRLRVTRAGRDVALRHRGRLTDLTIMVEHNIEPGGPLSMTARKVLKWLYHAHGLSYADAASPEALDLPGSAE